MRILAGMISLLQYKESKELKQNRLERCLCCGLPSPWLHGCYSRKADRLGGQDESLNPILIQRYYCPGCRQTCSVLPECLPPHRWYLWEIQQIAIILILNETSFNAVAKQIGPSRHTIRRWITHLKGQFHFHRDALCSHFIDFGQSSGFYDFWKTCLNKISLAQAMRLCHVAGVSIS